MIIRPDEIADIEEAGSLDNAPVKMIRTKGGFWIAIGKPNGVLKESALAAGSHPAIVKFNLEKTYPNFQPLLMKSEGMVDPQVEKHSHFLPEDLRKSGHDIYSVQTGMNIDFHVSRHGAKVFEIKSSIEAGSLVFSKDQQKMDKSMATAFASAVSEKALSSNLKKIVLK